MHAEESHRQASTGRGGVITKYSNQLAVSRPLRSALVWAILLFGGLSIGLANLLAAPSATPIKSDQASGPGLPQANLEITPSIDLSDKQLASVKVGPITEHDFPIEKQAVGSIDFNEEMLTQVFTPYQGRIIRAFASAGEFVKKDQVLFTIDSPDLVQAVSTLIAAAGVLDLTTKNLERQRSLYQQSAAAQRDYEQAISDQQTAEGALKAARDAVRIFGKTDAEIDKIVADRKMDPVLVVPSPISGLITARNAAPGLLVQPGNAPAPYTVADISTMWMLANIPERDTPDLKIGLEVKVSVPAYPGRIFQGKISTIGATVDPNTRRILVRSEIDDPQHELRSGMLAVFSITIAAPKRALAAPETAVVREGDGTMTLWFTADRHRFLRRSVKTGLSHDGFVEIVEGAELGELVATEGAIFIANEFANARR